LKRLYIEIDPKACAWMEELVRAGSLPPGDVWCRDLTTIHPDEVREYGERHWCAGIGVWAAALQMVGWEGPVDTVSLPCQPFSVAGKQKGKDDERHLWPAFFEIIRELRPPVLLGEQVSAAIAHGWIDRVFDDLESQDYACGQIVLPACSTGAPHIRQRLWWVGHATDANGRTGERGTEAGTRASECRRRGSSGDGADGGLADIPSRGQRADGRAPGQTGHADECSPFDLWRDSRWHQCRDGKQRRVPIVRAEWVEHADGYEQGREPREGRKPQGRDASGGASGGGGVAKPDGEERRGRKQRLHASDGNDCRTAKAQERATGLDDSTPPPQPRIQLVFDDGAAPCSGVDAGWDGSFFPLAPKTEGRVMILKGAGNAICLGTAAAFVRAAMEAIHQ